MTSARDIRKFSSLLHEDQVYTFLDGLDDQLDKARSDVLQIHPFPMVEQAYAYVCQEDIRQAVMLGRTETTTNTIMASNCTKMRPGQPPSIQLSPKMPMGSEKVSNLNRGKSAIMRISSTPIKPVSNFMGIQSSGTTLRRGRPVRSGVVRVGQHKLRQHTIVPHPDILTKKIIGHGTKREGLYMYYMEDFCLGRAHVMHPVQRIFTADASFYDYSASIDCQENPPRAQYKGGIVQNPEFDAPLGKSWEPFGGAKIELRESATGRNKFIVAHSRNNPFDSFSQKFFLRSGHHYTFSAWLQVSGAGKAAVAAVFKTKTGYKPAGAIVAESGCWSMLKGGVTMDAPSSTAHLYFENKNTSVEIWADSISFQPFTDEEWRSHHQQSIEKTRKSRIKFHAADAKGNPLAGASISIKQKKPRFPFGNSMNKNILTNPRYQKWFASRFTVTTFENEMKWYDTEVYPGRVDYSVPDAMLHFAQQNNIDVRGHNILWDDFQYQPWWVKSLSPSQLAAAVAKRINSVVSRYAGKLIAWDVLNENLHYSFYENTLGRGATAGFYQRACQIDGRATLFMNEYNTIEMSQDWSSSPARYLQKLREIRGSAASCKMGIGLEAHFTGAAPNLAYMRASIDTLAAAGLPMWITELDLQWSPYQALYLEQVLREAHAHSRINGIVMWASMSSKGECYRMCLTDYNLNNLPTGNIVDKLISEWSHKGFKGKTDAEGLLETSLFHGDYEVMISHPTVMNSSISQSFKVESIDTLHEKSLLVKVSI
ncbi:endo-1,4-beta-xylanase 5-like [Malania oleifera]|uniref:endo-1,4-beta-xylanase 5-like n=1 Tax=Malania oleifera TaxID=397392 RepID=UPI0025ADDE85|nr:endo-1,4-beta-xylanase 5-like [Malania oleifera]